MWIDDWKTELQNHYDTPDEFIEAMGYFTVGAALANRVYVRSPKFVGSNMYLILTSPPGWMHKSSTVGCGVELLRQVISSDEILPSNPSMEALSRKVPALCQGEVGHGVLLYDEFKSFLTHVRKEYASSLASLVTEKLERGMPVTYSKTKDSGTEDFVIPGKFVFSMVASTTTPWLLENMRGSDIGGGMMARFLLVEARKQTRMYELPPPMDDTVVQRLAIDLQRIRNNHSLGSEYTFRSDAVNMYSAIYRDLKKDAEGHGHPEYSALVSRGPLYLKKLSLIRAVLAERGSHVIHPEDVDAAGEMVWRSVRSCRQIVDEAAAHEGPWGKAILRVRKIVEAARDVPKADLLKFVHVRPRELDEVLESLVQQGLVEVTKDERQQPVVSWMGSSDGE